ncbi:MAG: hypothetical protein AAF456_16130 [Planctomycetota bacterium]
MSNSFPINSSQYVAVFAAALFACVLCGCDQMAGDDSENVAENGGQVEPQSDDPESPLPEDGPTPEEQEATLEWMMNKLRDARDAGGETIDGTSQWATDTFERLRDNGLTTAENATDWVTQDFNNMWAWEYRVVSGDTDPEAMEVQLNELGQSGWECFHVQTDENGAPVFYFKKHKRSYLKSIPMKDLLRLLPVGGGDGGE